MRRLSAQHVSRIKIVLFILLVLPSIVAATNILRGEVAEPADYITHITGEWTLRLLLLTLFIRPFVNISSWHWLIKLRRMIGLYVFYYAVLHFCAYLLLDLQLDFSTVLEDIIKRKYITLGFIALLLLLPLAITSNDALIKKLGSRRWGRLHQAIYFIVPLGITHYWLQIKGDEYAEPLTYSIITFLLLLMRYPPLAQKLRQR
ncbi:MAG: sulfoxide reductase heme-binding subunit YedZ [Proteobacteria bacterium]|nr:sulfoxide reductase heme-binding subunit YedZ [Pseudomonadota bacterium]